MPDFAVQVTLGDTEFRLDRVKVSETERVVSMTGYRNKREWFDAIQAEEPKALIAAYIIAKARQGEKIRWDDVDFDDDVNARWVDDDGREVEPLFEKNDDGTFKTDENGRLVPVLRDGEAVWVFSDSQEEVRPTEASSTPTSDMQEQPGRTLAFVSGMTGT